VLANHPACAGPLQARLLPTLLSILSSADASGGGQPAGLKEHSHEMNILSHILKIDGYFLSALIFLKHFCTTCVQSFTCPYCDTVPLKSTALDVLCTLVRASPLPLSDQLMQVAFPAIVQVGWSQIQYIPQGIYCLICEKPLCGS
jgi:hypothetical protein